MTNGNLVEPLLMATAQETGVNAVTWANVRCALKDAARKEKGEERAILAGVDGYLKHRSLTCVLGGSGAGKTTMLSILGGRASRGNLTFSGGILVNGQRLEAGRDQRALSKLFGFVEQHDLVWATSTAYEALYFSARMRLPASLSDGEVASLVEEMIVKLSLERCRDTQVGNADQRGLSGGEMKRVSIGLELLARPKILLLDEPTSGLDSRRASDVVRILSRLIETDGTTVMCTIHQPSSELFHMFHYTMVMDQGRMVYCGPTKALGAFLESLGRPVPTDFNSADFALLVVSEGDLRAIEFKLPRGEPETEALLLEEGGGDLSHPSVPSSRSTATPSNVLLPKPSPSPPLTSSSAASSPVPTWEKNAIPISGLRKMAMLTRREAQSVWRNKMALKMRLSIVLGVSLAVGLVLYRMGRPSTKVLDIQSHFACITLMTTTTMISMSNPVVLSFPLERIIVTKEVRGGTYSSNGYFWSRIGVEVLTAAVQSSCSLAILQALVDLQGSFLGLFGVLFLLSMIAASVGFFVSVCVSEVRTAVSLNPVLIIPQILFAGFVVPITAIPFYLKPLTYVSQIRWAIALLALEEFKHDPAAEYILSENSISEDDAWKYWLVLLANFVVFRLGAMAILRRRITRA